MLINSAVCQDCDIRLDAKIELSPLACLDANNQSFVVEFLKHHGSIKRMEQVFGVSYPTVKNRLTQISQQLTDGSTSKSDDVSRVDSDRVMSELQSGTITVQEAIEQLRL